MQLPLNYWFWPLLKIVSFDSVVYCLVLCLAFGKQPKSLVYWSGSVGMQTTGLQDLQAIICGDVPQPPMALTMGLAFVEIEGDTMLMHATADERHLNPMGGVHGGFAATVLDSVTGCVVHAALAAGESYGTIDLAVKMMRPIPVNQRLRVEGKLLNMSKSLGVSEGRIVDDNGKLYAHATCTCKINRVS